MTMANVRTTLSLPAELLEMADEAVRKGWARSRNAFVAAAIQRELEAQTRAEIDAEIAEMANDPEYLEEALRLESEYVVAGWEALQISENES
jgi:metal-responsive CopG/Arc/MetJ family transcriptional regulator